MDSLRIRDKIFLGLLVAYLMMVLVALILMWAGAKPGTAEISRIVLAMGVCGLLPALLLGGLWWLIIVNAAPASETSGNRQPTLGIISRLTGKFDDPTAMDWRSDGEKAIAYRAQRALDGDYEKVARRLVMLLADGEANSAEIREIGAQLCSQGGPDHMRMIAYRANSLGIHIRLIELYWDGICGWRY